ncbi:MAG: cupin domain-containing protein [Chloroflexi bacterium]|nr:cupin domain-containing protein [Chloroflexota bacterium]
MSSGQTAKSTVFIDNERVRVTEWRFAPGTATGQHRHQLDYVVVPTITGALTIRDTRGETPNNIVAGSPYFRKAGAEHNVANETDAEVAFIEIELK